MATRIDIIGAIDPALACSPDLALELFALPAQVLGHDGEFTGRPLTRIQASPQHVLKLRLAGPAQGLREQTEETLLRERLYGVYHPARTWLIVTEDQGPQAGVWLGNVTPRLRALHLPQAEEDAMVFFRHVRAMLQMYLRIAARFRVRLDEGLSNFAVDDAGQLHYLDDDVYPWDDFAHFSQSVGVLIRKLRTLTPKFAQMLGQTVRQAIVGEFGDAGACRRVADGIRGLYYNGDDQSRRLDGFIEGLLGAQPHSRTRATLYEQRPFALLADIHANRPALETALAGLRQLGVDRGIVLGDIVGYGPHPAECIELVRDSGFEVVRGNHDDAVAGTGAAEGFTATAARVVEWTRQRLDDEARGWLGQLPTRLEREGWVAQHGAPMDPAFFRAYVYRMTYEDNLRYLAERGLRWAFHGHSHIAGIFYATPQRSGFSDEAEQSLLDYREALICPGSVGQPRGGSLETQWAVFNPATTQIHFFRAPYDVELTLRDMAAQDFPGALMDRLRTGT